MTDDQGQPRQENADRELISFNTAQAAARMNVDSRTIRRWISDGIQGASGQILRLPARQVKHGRAKEWQIYEHDLEDFKKQQDQLATEGVASTQIEESQHHVMNLSLSIIATELERRSQEVAEAQAQLAEAHEKIEQLAREAGYEAGRRAEIEHEAQNLRSRVAELESEKAQWQVRQAKAPQPRRIHLLSFLDRDRK